MSARQDTTLVVSPEPAARFGALAEGKAQARAEQAELM